MKNLIVVLFTIVVIINPSIGQTLTQYQYWYDDDYSSVYTQTLSTSDAYISTSLSTPNLSDGLHSVIYRVKDNNGKWSVTNKEYFYKLSSQSNIKEIEFWYDTAYSGKHNTLISGALNIIVIDTIVNNLSDGIHIFNIRVCDSQNRWSVVLSEYFTKKSSQSNISLFEYWFNDDFLNKKTTQIIEPAIANFETLQLDVSSLDKGTHTVCYRTRTSNYTWSVVNKDTFINNYNFNTYPTISLSKTELKSGEVLNISLSNFGANSSGTLKINGKNADGIEIPYTTNDMGTNSNILSYFIPTNHIGVYTVSSTQAVRSQTVPPQMFNVSYTAIAADFNRVLKIVTPSISSTYDLSDNKKVMLKWSDVIYNISKLNPATAISNKLYTIEYKWNNGSWTTANTQTYQSRGVYTSTDYFQYEFSFTQVGTYQFRIKETDNIANWDTTISLTVNGFTNTGNMAVFTVWDFSGNRPSTVAPYAICADGTARMYVVLERKNFNELTISKIKATVLDDENIGPNDPKVLGKIMPATELNKYSLEANNASSQSAEYPITADDKNSHYYFWYVAPDNFTRNSADNYRGERYVNIQFEVTYSSGSKETYSKKIAVYRPPLMLVHGWTGDPSTWDDLDFNYGSSTLKFKDASNIFKAKIRLNTMLKSDSFVSNAILLTDQSIGNANSFAYNIRDLRNRGICANKVDYICHSMGGCMLRAAIDRFPSKFNPDTNSTLVIKNYSKGFANKIITINTPHWGSPGADLIVDYLSKLNYGTKQLLSLVPMKDAYSFEFGWGVGLYYDNVLGKFLPIPQKVVKKITPRPAVYNMQFFNKDEKIGGVRFSNVNGIKAHLIAGRLSNSILESESYINQNINQVHNDLNWWQKTLFSFATWDFDTKNGIKSIPTNKVREFIDNEMNRFGVPNFMQESDLVVGLNSQLSGGDFNNIKPYESIFNGFNAEHTKNHHTTLVGNKCISILNSDINSNVFTSTFSAHPEYGKSGIKLKSSIIKPIDSTVEKFNDTTKYRLTNSIASLNYVDSTIAIQINVKDTNKLLANTIVFQGQMYFNKLEKGNLLYLLKVNPNYIDSQLLVTTLTYDSVGYNVHYNMTYPIKIVPQDTLRALTCEPKLKYLNAKEEYHPSIYANFGKYISNISLNNSDVSISIADPNVMSFNGNQFVAKDTGSTYAIVTYRGLKDTIYFVISPPIEIVPEACVPPTVDFSVSTNGKVATCTNLSTNATTYKWSMGNGDIVSTANPVYTYSTKGDYLVCLTSYNTCDSTKICKTIKISDASVAISNPTLSNVTIYPNPTSTLLNIDLIKNEQTTVRIENLLGQVIMIKNLNGLKNQINISTLPKGIYLLELSNTKGEKYSQKLTVD